MVFANGLLADRMAAFFYACALVSYGSNCTHLYRACEYTHCSQALNQPEGGALRSKPTSLSGANSPTVRRKGNEMKDLQSCILKHWIHSHEEDEQGIMVYRPANYNFPPSRGRAGFEFREGGTLVYYGIGRADGSEQSSGRWLIKEPNRVRVHVDNERIQPFVLEVISCDDQVLKVKR